MKYEYNMGKRFRDVMPLACIFRLTVYLYNVHALHKLWFILVEFNFYIYTCGFDMPINIQGK